jgi:thioredoxin reductase (NADPH)
LDTLVIDRIGPGGQAGTSSKIENYKGFPTRLSCANLANRAVIQAEKLHAMLSAPAEVVKLSSANGYCMLRLEEGEDVSAKCIIIAAGASHRKLNADGCEQFEGSSIYYAATTMETQLCRNAQVMVVDNGNSAGQAVVFLSNYCATVLLVISGGDLGKSMRITS